MGHEASYFVLFGQVAPCGKYHRVSLRGLGECRHNEGATLIGAILYVYEFLGGNSRHL